MHKIRGSPSRYHLLMPLRNLTCNFFHLINHRLHALMIFLVILTRPVPRKNNKCDPTLINNFQNKHTRAGVNCQWIFFACALNESSVWLVARSIDCRLRTRKMHLVILIHTVPRQNNAHDTTIITNFQK